MDDVEGAVEASPPAGLRVLARRHRGRMAVSWTMESRRKGMTAEQQMQFYEILVSGFAKEMLRVLKQNSRFKVGHRHCNAAWLTTKLLEEAGEVAKLLRRSADYQTGRIVDMSRQKARCIARECADVANIAMMLADLAVLAASAKPPNQSPPPGISENIIVEAVKGGTHRG